jgi:heme/copper-type cytochrome/quinol oxidase subunit 2
MPMWLIFAAVVTIGVTGLLVWLLYRINLTAGDRPDDRAGD